MALTELTDKEIIENIDYFIESIMGMRLDEMAEIKIMSDFLQKEFGNYKNKKVSEHLKKKILELQTLVVNV